MANIQLIELRFDDAVQELWQRMKIEELVVVVATGWNSAYPLLGFSSLLTTWLRPRRLA